MDFSLKKTPTNQQLPDLLLTFLGLAAWLPYAKT
jgi:hypothetical protein